MPTRIDRPYAVPQMRRIGRGDDTERLYTLEDRRDAAIRAATTELQNVLRKVGLLPERADYFRDVLPEALLNILDAHDTRAAILAALSFLDHVRTVDPKRYTEMEAYWQESRR